ncbi:MAG: PQQ-binding-like beta-propeller repeat protein, partial [Armatimonadota bacterium]|nr:PQQ-binding-like beta-propeller repeat protein [Armatimonadota bacterium]
AELWRYPWKTSYDVNAAIPNVAGNKLFNSSGYGKGCALLQIAKDEEPLVWQNRNMKNHFSSSVLYDGYIYGFDESELKCLDFRTGNVKWSKGGMGKGSLIAADGQLIVLSERVELVIVEASPNRYTEQARAQILGGKCWTAPALSGGRVYARNADGDLVCVDVKGG